jgi:hypothetical protein
MGDINILSSSAASAITGTAAIAVTAAATGIKGGITGTAALAFAAAAAGIKARTTGTADLAFTGSAAVRALFAGTAGLAIISLGTNTTPHVGGS